MYYQELLSAGLALSVKGGALFQNEHRRRDIPENTGSATKLDPLAGGNVTFNLPAYDGHAHLDIGFHLAVLT
jgi:hypothetical protein